jgi:hypothetical protein
LPTFIGYENYNFGQKILDKLWCSWEQIENMIGTKKFKKSHSPRPSPTKGKKDGHP